jgi:hypothetical protein
VRPKGACWAFLFLCNELTDLPLHKQLSALSRKAFPRGETTISRIDNLPAWG